LGPISPYWAGWTPYGPVGPHTEATVEFRRVVSVNETLTASCSEWDVECCIAEPPCEEPSSRHGGESESDGEAADAPRSVFIDETEDADEDLFGDPDADLDADDDEDDEPTEPEAMDDDENEADDDV
jgi:hypothetical protein